MLLLRKAHPATRTMIGGDPTPEQAMAGDYPKLRREWHGLTIAIEHPEGTVREGVDETGKPWRTVFRYAYGEILGTLGMDGDPVDVFIGSYPDAPEVYIVQQMKRKQWDVADEQKVMIDFGSMDEAKAAYLGHYDDPRFFGGITAMPVDEFIAKVRATKDKPAMIKALLLKTHVSGYTKQDGTFVPPHEDKRQSLQDDLQRQEKWLHEKALELGYSGIEDMLEKDYPAFERLAWQWREQNPVEVAMKSMVLFFKGYVGPYLRGGKIVNARGYQGRSARAQASAGQMSLFGAGEPQHTEPTRELIEEHERLIDVLNSPSHEDDKVEAKKQAAELKEMKQEVAKPDSKILFIKPSASAESKQSYSNLSNNSPEATAKESTMKPLTDEQRTKIARGGAAWDAWKATQPDGATRAAFKEAARAGQLDHLYAVQMEADAKRDAEVKASKKAKNDAWRERNVPKLAAAKQAQEEKWRAEKQAKWSDPNGPRTYLTVPFAYKDQVKDAGARWDADKRSWYHTFPETPDALRQWLPKAAPAAASAPKQVSAAPKPAPKARSLPTSGTVSPDDPSIYGSWLLGYEYEPWSRVREYAPAHLR